jgi:hypothetical protein
MGFLMGAAFPPALLGMPALGDGHESTSLMFKPWLDVGNRKF